MNEPSTVTYTTADILKRIEDKLDKLGGAIVTAGARFFFTTNP